VVRRLVPVLGVVAIVAAACGRPDIVVRSEEPEGPSWFSVVVDSTSDAEAGLSLATDAEGNPHLAYLAFEEEVEGEAPASDPLAPTLPAVMHAHMMQDAWTRGPVAEEQDLDAESETAIAVDADGVHHVVWSTPDAVLYSSNAEGEFAEEPEDIAPGDVTGLSVAVDARGTPIIAFQTALDSFEGPASLIRIVTPSATDWKLQTVAEASAPEDPAGTAVLVTSDGPVVAFGSDGQTVVASRQGDRWVSETVDPDGGVGVAGAVDADGNPHLAYLTAGGDVKHAHSIEGSPWELSNVGSGATGSPASIAVDAEGVHPVAWQTGDGLGYAGNASGDFAEEELPASTAAGTGPRIGVGPDGTVYVAFRDEADTEVQMAVRSEDAPLLAAPAPEETGGDGGTIPTGPPPCQPEGAELSIVAQNLQFDTDCLAAPAGEPFSIEFTNEDALPHNVSIFTDQSATQALFQEPAFPGPETVTYEPEPFEEEGNFFFRCDIHPTTMTGTFVVAAAGGEAPA
jgi:plastocyanin